MNEQLNIIKLLPLKQLDISLSNRIIWILFPLLCQFFQVLDEGELISLSNGLADHHIEVFSAFGIILTPLNSTTIEI